MMALTPTSPLILLPSKFRATTPRKRFTILANNFPPFLPKQVENLKDSFARSLASRIQRLPVSLSDKCIMTSCVKPSVQSNTTPVVLLHGFDSTPNYESFVDVSKRVTQGRNRLQQQQVVRQVLLSMLPPGAPEQFASCYSSCLEWRYSFPLLEEAGLEAWALDILGWGFSDLESLPSCDVASKRNHLYQFWRSHIKRPMILVGPSLGAAVAIDFTVNHPEAVENLILIDASVYAEGTGDLANLPKTLAYAGASILKSTPLRLYANFLCFNSISLSTAIDWMNVGRLHCLYPWWEDATVNFMLRGGYSISNLIDKVEKRTLIIWGEDDRIISNKLAVRLHCELRNAILRQIPDCGHIPHVENPQSVAKLMVEFIKENCYKEVQV